MSYYKHGMTPRGVYNSTYFTWAQMKQRCTNPKHDRYANYGGRGISYDPRWEDYQEFYADMGERPQNLTLGRLENDKDYYKDNCSWQTYEVQSFIRSVRADNSSGMTGVSWKSANKKWMARVTIRGIEYVLYYGKSFEEACLARQEWNDAFTEALRA